MHGGGILPLTWHGSGDTCLRGGVHGKQYTATHHGGLQPAVHHGGVLLSDKTAHHLLSLRSLVALSFI